MTLDHSLRDRRNSSRLANNPFRRDVISGLSRQPKTLPSKYFYDARGSTLFDRITETPEYYPTRREAALLEAHAHEMMHGLDENAVIVEFGAGSSIKMEPLLASAPEGATFVPIDVSASALRASARRLAAAAPHLAIHPRVADFAALAALPEMASRGIITAFFLGSTIGNFAPEDAVALLARWKRILGPRARLVVGADLIKDREILERAYNDAAGVTAAFNLNILRRINREIEPAFDLSKFAHVAFFNERQHRIEMHLKSSRRQSIDLSGTTVALEAGETIHTENSYKYSHASLAALGEKAGWTPACSWTDGWFIVQELCASNGKESVS